YRLSVVAIHVPPLRSRPEDIPMLAGHFLSQYWARHRDGKATPPRLTEAALRVLRAYPWRGNVRELQNVMEHAVVLLAPGAEIQPADLPFLAEARTPQTTLSFPTDGALEESYYASRARLVADFVRRFLLMLVHRESGNMYNTDWMGGLVRTTLFSLLQEHGI